MILIVLSFSKICLFLFVVLIVDEPCTGTLPIDTNTIKI